MGFNFIWVGRDDKGVPVNVALSGDYALLNLVRESFPTYEGRQYIFKRVGSEWVRQSQLIPDGALPVYGNAAALSGDYAIVDSLAVDELEDYVRGTAHVFERRGENWVQVKRFPTDESEFGVSIAMSENYAIIGAPDFTGLTQEAAYIFVK